MKKQDRIVKTIASQRGMTLIEIMVVIAIIGILATALGVAVVNYLKSSKEKTAGIQVESVAQGLDSYYANQNPSEYPDDLNDLTKGKHPFVKSKSLVDPWGSTLVYSTDGDTFELCSPGEDKRSGGEDDICYEQE